MWRYIPYRCEARMWLQRGKPRRENACKAINEGGPPGLPKGWRACGHRRRASQAPARCPKAAAHDQARGFHPDSERPLQTNTLSTFYRMFLHALDAIRSMLLWKRWPCWMCEDAGLWYTNGSGDKVLDLYLPSTSSMSWQDSLGKKTLQSKISLFFGGPFKNI